MEKNTHRIEPTPAAWELYDLRPDPFENRNVHGGPAYRDIAQFRKGDTARSVTDQLAGNSRGRQGMLHD